MGKESDCSCDASLFCNLEKWNGDSALASLDRAGDSWRLRESEWKVRE